MNNNSANVVEDGAVKLPIEEKYQKDIQKWLKDTMAETGLPIERVVTEVFLHRMSHNNIHPEHCRAFAPDGKNLFFLIFF